MQGETKFEHIYTIKYTGKFVSMNFRLLYAFQTIPRENLTLYIYIEATCKTKIRSQGIRDRSAVQGVYKEEEN